MQPWTHPKHYGGFSPDGDFLLISVHRDSDALDRSNWRRIKADLGCEAYDGGDTDFDSRPTVYDWRAGHCLVGWVEYLMIRKDAPADTLDKARAIADALESYPAYDENDWSELEWDETCEYWERMSVKERVEYLQDAGLSIFAARRGELPADDSGALFERLRG